MKRWQERGVVEDSEDDELSLDDTPSPERPRKRTKHSQDGEPAGNGFNAISQASQGTAGSKDADEHVWIQPKVARTYGKLRKIVKQVSRKSSSPPISEGTSVLESALVQNAADETLKHEQLAPGSPRSTPTNLVALGASETSVCEHQFSTSSLVTKVNTTPEKEAVEFPGSKGSLHPQGSRSRSPSPCRSRSRSRNGDDSLDRGRSRASSSESLSSLSEREVSPPTDWPFLKLNSTSNSESTQVWSIHPTTNDSTIPGHNEADYELPSATARRSLRRRKPIQLQPYELERALYLQKCKSRGMRGLVEEERERAARKFREETQVHSSQSEQIVFAYSEQSTQLEAARKKASGPETTLSFSNADTSDTSSENSDHLSDRPPKRRRIMTGLDAETTQPWPHLDDFSVPPSPPRTASDTSVAGEGLLDLPFVAKPFRKPLGLTPVPLPTPQISSDVREPNGRLSSSLESSPRRRPRSALARRRAPSIISVSSDAGEDSEPEIRNSDLEAKLLRRQAKRLRGVLPASWIKIDFNAQRTLQSPSTSKRPGLSTASPSKHEPQKGVARRVTTNKTHDRSFSAFPTFSGDDTESDTSVQALDSVRKLSRLDVGLGGFNLSRTEKAFDDDVMENDFIDPMLAGPSGQSNTRQKRTHEPRITEAFRKSSTPRVNFSEERLGHGRASKPVKRSKPSKLKHASRQRRERRPVVRLSIADAPRSPSQAETALPDFVRIALRHTRQDANRGRHSPTSKIVRLPTMEDTADAMSVLRAWRDGTMAPRPEITTQPLPLDNVSRPPRASRSIERTPLANLSPNKKQQVFSSPLRKPTMGSRTVNLSTRRPRLRQTQLSPVVTEGNIDSTGHASDERPHIPNLPTTKPRMPPQMNRLRDAQLESLENDFHQGHRAAVFESRMQRLTEHIARPTRSANGLGLQLERFLRAEADHSHGIPEPDAQGSVESQPPAIAANPTSAFTLPHRSRKRQAHRLDVETRQYRQPNEPIPEVTIENGQQSTPLDMSRPTLQGLGGFGTRYPVDFDMRPLDAGTHFHPSTFIGSGEFNEALHISQRDLDIETGHMRVHLNNEILEWGTWNEDVAASLAKIPVAITDAIQTLLSTEAAVDRQEQQQAVDRNIDYLLRSVVRYGSKCLSFTDSIDRAPCVDSLLRLVETLLDIVIDGLLSDGSVCATNVRMAQYQLVITKQALQISAHYAVSSSTRLQLEQLLLRAADVLAKRALLDRFDELRSCYEDLRRVSVRNAGIKDEYGTLSSIVILNHTLPGKNSSSSLFWQAISVALEMEVNNVCNVSKLEGLWYDIFTILPGLEIDAFGIARIGSRLQETQHGAALAKSIVARVLELYDASTHVRGYSPNDYIRATLSRCFCLVHRWGWWRCEPLLNTIYDFFARRSLSLLHKEEARGSPKFLQDLASHSSLEIFPDDRSFHIFLKTLLVGLRGMSKYAIYDDRKIRGIAYRLLPNHNRTFQRDKEVQRCDLDALRNHYDLLCTLYYSTPSGYRISLDGIKSLIDHSSSHREACRISVRAWANITSFQASIKESADLMFTLSGWFAEIYRTTLAQYRLAKSEAQEDFQRAQKEAEQKGGQMTIGILEDTIVSNQKAIAETIIDALAGLKRAVGWANSLPTVKCLIEGSEFWSVFDLFEPTQGRLVKTLLEALRVVSSLLEVSQRHSTGQRQQQADSDDSQDFGDFSALEELVDDTAPAETSTDSPIDTILGPVGHFVSNVFGADKAADGTLLQSLLDVWVRLASHTVKHGGKSWMSYVDEYSANSWNQMRDTAQKRKYTTYFMSRVIEEDSGRDEEVKSRVTTYWLLSLVEREATLKFQHELTSALLNNSRDEPLLHNLPFSKDNRVDRYQITPSELRSRRLALISSVLCNMREHYELVAFEHPTRKTEVKSTYADLLRRMMQAMKANYQELQTSRNDDVADGTVQGAYVDFVQQVVSLLQQYAKDICQVDRFFTDSTAFPLPATDPTYVVGRLRSYVPKLDDANARMQLAIFVQTVSERAAIDGQQVYLVDQMSTAMKGVTERGDENAPSLRQVLLTSIFPAYIENVFSHACSWIPALPMLQASETALSELLYNVPIEDANSVASALDTMNAMLHSISQVFENVLVHPNLLGSPHVLKTLTAMLHVSRSCLTPASHLDQAPSPTPSPPTPRLRILREQALQLEAHLRDSLYLGSKHDGPEYYTSRYPDTRVATDKQLHESLHANWFANSGRYFVRRGHTTRELLAVELSDSAEEQRRLLHVIASFCGSYNATFNPRRRRRRIDGDDGILESVVV